MTKTLKNILLYSLFYSLSVPAFSASAQTYEARQVAKAFCPQTQIDSAYDQNDLTSYKQLLAGNDGWVFRTGSKLTHDFEIREETITSLLAVQNKFKEHGIDLVTLYVPTRGMMHTEYLRDTDRKKYMPDPAAIWDDYNTLTKKLSNKGAHIVTLPATTENNKKFFYKRDHHWNRFGAQKSAQQVAEFIKSLPAYEQITKQEFSSTEKEQTEFKGIFNKVTEKLCGKSLPDETITTVETEPVKSGSSFGDLFGKQKAPEIVLLGTSNSTDIPQANFEGYLKEYLSADIMNMSIAGKGVKEPLEAYIEGGHYKNPETKIIIWEVPGYYRLDHLQSFLNEMVQALEE